VQFRVLCLGWLQDWDVWVGIFPKCEEILICILGLRGDSLQGVGTAQLELRERLNEFDREYICPAKDFLKLGYMGPGYPFLYGTADRKNSIFPQADYYKRRLTARAVSQFVTSSVSRIPSQ